MLFGIAAGIVLGILIVAFLALLKLLNPSPTLEHSLESGAYLAALLYILGVVILAVRLMDRLGLSLIREYIKSSLETASCPHCRQLLIGLPPRSGKITCPECGTSINLSDYDLSEVTWERIAAAQGSID
ncbi:MAG: hypothetical protein D8M59_14610 [Planctomycetes bacterium]|nr:hypothetical protein [Planctomycetota bacterium]